MAEPGREAAPLLIGPDVFRLKAQGRLKFGITAPVAEVDPVEAGERVEVHKLIIDLHFMIFGPAWDHAPDMGGDAGRVVAEQHAEPLVALLNVKPAQKFIAFHRVADAFFAQVGITEADPLGGKFTCRFQQGHEIPGEGRRPSGGLGTDKTVGRHLDNAEIGIAGDGGFLNDVIQHERIGIFAVEDGVFVVFLPSLQGMVVLFNRFRSHETSFLFSFRFRRMTAARISSTPRPEERVRGSLKTSTPISVATIGSMVARIPARLASTVRRPSV